MTGLFLCVLVWLANNANPPTGRTGAPFDGSCNDCHSGGSFTGDVEVTGLPSTIEPNTTYPLMITMTPTAGSPVRGGFQLVVVDGNNANSGDLTAGNSQSGTEFFSSREYLEHRGSKNFNGGPVSWSFNWKSPVSAAGNTIKLYFIGNFTNGNNQDTGDKAFSFLDTYNFSGAPPVTATITGTTNVSCAGGNTGSATVEGGGGVPPYTYLWSNGQNTQTAVNLTANTYTVTVTGSSGSGSATATAVITQPTALLTSASVTGTLTCLVTSVNATATASGGTAPYTFNWSNGETGSPVALTAPGTYVVTTTDANGCTKTASVTVQSNTVPPNAVAGPSVTLTCIQPTANLNGAGSSSGPTFSYLWTASNGGNIVSGATTLTPLVNAAGTYTLKVTNSVNGCTSTASTTATSNIQLPTANTTGTTLTCTNTSDTIFVSTNAPSATFAWVGPNNFTSSQQNPIIMTAGTYTVTVTNTSTGCSKTATATVALNNTVPTVSASGGLLNCTVTSDTMFSTSNAPNSTFLWNGPNNYTSAQQNPIVSMAGTYTVVATNPANGCTASATASMSQNITAPTVSASGGLLNCTVTSDTMFSSSNAPNSTFIWSGPNNYTSMQQNPIVNAPGTYTVIATNPVNGCTASATASMNQNITPPSAAATGGQITCANSSVQLSATTNASPAGFAWTGPNGFSSTQQQPTTTAAGNYTVVVTDNQNGCTASAVATVTQNTTPPVASAFAPGNLNCNTPSVQLNGTASSQGSNFTYLWTTANGNIVSGETTLTPVVNAVGVYTLVVNNTLNGCTATTAVTVVQTPPVSAGINNVTPVSCNGGSNGAMTAAGSGGYGGFTYTWSTGANTATISNLAAGTYIVTIEDGEGCTATASATVTQPVALSANASATGETMAGASDGTASAAPSGGTPVYSYLWSNNATTATITGLAPGSYTVTVADANNCTAVQTVTVNSFNCTLSANATSTNVTCNGANNGTATVTLTGAAMPVTYLWSNGDMTATADNLAPGTYTVQVLDGNNCPAQLSVNITEPPVLLANATSTNQTGVGQNDGTATAQPTGGTSPYAYHWSNGETSAQITGLAPGAYTVTVTDNNGCSSSQTVVVNAFNCALSTTVSAAPVSCAGRKDGLATAIATGGTLPLAYLWSNGDTIATAANLAAGIYTVVITDATGCIASSTVTITEPTPLSPSLSNVLPATCPESSNGAATVSASGGTAPYDITWPGGSNGQNLAVGAYMVSVVDANGCSAVQSVTITSNDIIPPSLSCPAVPISVCAGEKVQYPVPAAADNCSLGGAQPELISGLPSGSSVPLGISTQVYRITDASGNSTTCSFNIIGEERPVITLEGKTNDVNNAGLGSIHVSVSGGSGYTYAWEKDGQPFANTEDLNNLKAGTYTLVVTTSAGCTAVLANVEISNTVGTSAPGESANIRIAPNPVRDELRLDLSGIQLAAVQIFDLNGRLVRQLLPSEWTSSIDVSGFAPGLYGLNVLVEGGQWKMLKWMKAD